jgi:DNA polymerase IV
MYRSLYLEPPGSQRDDLIGRRGPANTFLSGLCRAARGKTGLDRIVLENPRVRPDFEPARGRTPAAGKYGCCESCGGFVSHFQPLLHRTLNAVMAETFRFWSQNCEPRSKAPDWTAAQQAIRSSGEIFRSRRAAEVATSLTSDPPSEDDTRDSRASQSRKVIHIDMDAFYASVEQRDQPDLRGKPVAVGGPSRRGVVAAASYEARKFGVRSAMASVTAVRKCPELIFVKPRFDIYRAVSQQIREVFAQYTDMVEPLSLDEAYLDVTQNKLDMPLATKIAEDIRAKIRAETGLTASAGVSYNKFLAKLASDYRKPDGLYVITPRMGPAFVATLEVGRFHGVGPATAAKMKALGIETGADLRACALPFLESHFGKAGAYYYGVARGIDERPVRADRVRKSMGAENTFFDDLTDFEAMRDALQPILDKLWRHCETAGIHGRTVTLKMKFADFRIITRSRSVAGTVNSRVELEAISLELLRPLVPPPLGVRLLGISISNLAAGEIDGAATTQMILL